MIIQEGITADTTFTVGGLEAGMTYRFSVVPLNEYGDGPSKSIVVSTTGGKHVTKVKCKHVTKYTLERGLNKAWFPYNRPDEMKVSVAEIFVKRCGRLGLVSIHSSLT